MLHCSLTARPATTATGQVSRKSLKTQLRTQLLRVGIERAFSRIVLFNAGRVGMQHPLKPRAESLLARLMVWGVLLEVAGCGGSTDAERVAAMDSGTTGDARLAPQDAALDASEPEPESDAAADANVDSATLDAGVLDASPTDASPTDTGAVDAATPDADEPEAAAPDSGQRDPCASNDPASTLGCNGPRPGAAPANSPGGTCSPAEQAYGTCEDTTLFCAYQQCAALCSPPASTIVSTGGCPSGFRCWDEGLLSFCFPDCDEDSDCGAGSCTSGKRCR